MANRDQKKVKKSVNSALAWSSIAAAVAVFLLIYITQFGEVRVIQQQQQARFAIYEAQNYYGVRWLHIPGAKKPIVIPPASTYKNINGVWYLVNKAQSIPLSFVPTSLTVPTVAVANNNQDPTVQVRQDVVGPLQALFTAAAANRHSLTLRSSYRSSTTQQLYYDQALAGGTTEYVAVPGQSEHQTGLAIDVNNVAPNCTGCELDGQTALWLQENAYKYGFIVRYTAGKEQITGYNAEPWHLRYVGVLLATKLQESGLTLEEFTNLLVKKL